MKNKLVILDGSHLAYRAYHKFPNLHTLDGVNTSVVYGIPYIVESLIRKFIPDKAIITLDGGRSPFRMGLLPSYKQRDQKLGFDKEDFYRQKDDAMKFMNALGISISGKKGFEADDLIAMISRRYAIRGWDVIIISGDKDFNQLIDDNILVYNTGKNVLMDQFNLIKYTGYDPDQCVDYLCLTGDHSDNIPGYPGIGEIRGVKFLQEFGSVNRFLGSDNKFGKVDKQKLKEIYKFNRQIIDLKFFYRKFLIKEKMPIEHGIFNDEKLKKLCRQFETNSFLKPQFINTYKTLYEKTNLYHGS